MRRTVQLLLGALILAVVPTTAAAQERLITYVARACPSYTDVSANLARNNIQESLRDLGPDTDYVNGEPISPSKEEPGQPNCRPLVGWHFHLGEAIAGAGQGDVGRAVGRRRPLRHVGRHPGRHADVERQRRRDRLLAARRRDGPAHRRRVPALDAGRGLWVQGGDVDDPVMDRPYPQRYGFAALRCAIDNYNGDNVESINYPQGAATSTATPTTSSRRRPPARSSSRRSWMTRSVTTAQPFTFQGNISYTVDHTFTESTPPTAGPARRPSTAARPAPTTSRGRSPSRSRPAGR